MQAIGALNLLVELRVRTITVPGRDVLTTAPTANQSHIVNGVLALVNSVSKTAEAALNVQLAVGSTTVCTLVPFTATVTHRFTR